MKKVIDILGIVLPVLLLLFAITRSFLRKKASGKPRGRFLNFLSVFIIILLILVGVIRYLFWGKTDSADHGPKPEPLKVSKHSQVFNESLQKVLDNYYNMADAFAGNDMNGIDKYASSLKEALNSFKVEELKKDTSIYLTALDPLATIKSEADSISKQTTADDKRKSLNILSDNLRSLLVIVKYDLAKVYWQECTDAFGEETPGNWLSKTVEVKNPYPLKNNKDCGGPKDTLNYMPADTTKNNTQ